MMGTVRHAYSATINKIELSAEDFACLSPSPLVKDLGCIAVSAPFNRGDCQCPFSMRAGLFPAFASSIVAGACLLLEAIQGRGGNYLQLPKAKTLRSAFEAFFAFKIYKERKIVWHPGMYPSVPE